MFVSGLSKEHCLHTSSLNLTPKACFNGIAQYLIIFSQSCIYFKILLLEGEASNKTFPLNLKFKFDSISYKFCSNIQYFLLYTFFLTIGIV